MRKLWAISTVIVFCLIIAPASAGIIYVKQDSPGPTFDGKSWNSAYHKVQDGVNAASADEVWVATGTYVENITLKDKIGLYGGFIGNEQTRDQRDFKKNVTILDGNQAGSVVTASNTSVATIIDGFTIRNGKAANGGGIYGFSSCVTISNNIITGNTGTSSGGGILAYSPTVTGNTITGNTAPSGGGIYTGGSSPISNNIISGNTANYGAGIYSYQCPINILNNTIRNNIASSYGGGIYLSYCSGTVANNIILRNSGTIGGGIAASQTVTIANNTIVSNTATTAGGGLSYTSVTYVTDPHPIANNIIAFNSSGIIGYGGIITLSHNCVYGNQAYNYSNLSAGATDFSIDPKLKDLNSDDIHLQLDSPCLDTGDDTVVKSDWTDIDGAQRIQSDHVDVGADEVDRSQAPYVRMPIFSVESGLCPPEQSVAITCPTDGAVIHYTTNGIEPSETDAVIQSGGSVTVTAPSMTLMAKAWKDGYITSATKYAAYTVADTVATPTVTPDGGSLNSSTQVQISCSTSNAAIRYTTNGSVPIESDTWIASGSTILVDKSLTLNVRAFKQGMIPSVVKTAVYTMRQPMPLKVNMNASGSVHNGMSWNTAYLTILDALSGAIPGDEIWVAAGTYKQQLTMKNGVSLYGGFVGNEITRDQRAPATNVTIIDANKVDKAVVASSGITSATVIDGFSIVGATSASIYCDSAGPTISGNRIQDNTGVGINVNYATPLITGNVFSRNNGAISCSSPSYQLTVTRNVFENNTASSGGAISVYSGTVLISNNTFTANSSTNTIYGGGAIRCDSAGIISNNRFQSNTAVVGGAIDCSGKITIANNTFIGNSASKTGGAVIAHYGTPAIINNTLVNNHATTDGGAVYFGVMNNNGAQLINNIICSNSSGIKFQYPGTWQIDIRANCIYGNTTYDCADVSNLIGTNGNISTAPLIASIGNSNLHLQPGSPCIDAGENSVVTAGMTDMDGQPRNADGRVDIGADESDGTSYPFVMMPVFNPSPGIYTTPQDVTISCATSGSTIHYTTNGGDPTTSDPVYVPGMSIHIASNTALRAKAWKDGLPESDSSLCVYTITGTVATPVFTPSGGNLNRVTGVNITCATPNATIYYTTDGTEPTTSSTSGINVSVDRTMTIKAKAWKQDWATSETSQATFVMRPTLVYRVDCNATGYVHDGLSWKTAFTSITDAINATIPGDEVWVARGIYYGVNTPYAIGLYGGFAGNENVRAERNLQKNKSVIKGSVTIPLNVAPRIDGFTISEAYSAYGINCQGPAVIANNTISGNTYGGINVAVTSSVLRPLIVNNVIIGNTGNGIDGNQGDRLIVCNNTIVGNSGTGLVCPTSFGSNVIVDNNIFAMNGTGLSPSGVCLFNNNCFFSNVNADCLQPNIIGSNNNFCADPEFVNMLYGDLHIQPGSVCRDAGLDSIIDEAYDLDLKPRKQDAHVDVGAYETSGPSSTIIVSLPTVIKVRPDGNDNNDGLSWNTAKRTIGAAANTLSSGGEIWVQAGDIIESPIAIGPCIHIYGGFKGNELDKSQRDPGTNKSIITRNIAYFKSGLMESTIDGFTFNTGINSNAVICKNSRAAIRNCTFTGCSYRALDCDAATVSIENNTFSNNANAIYCSNSNATVTNNLVYNNSQSGIDCYYECSATITGNTIVGNDKSGSCAAAALKFTNWPTTRVSNNIVAFNGVGVSRRQPYRSTGNSIFCNNCVYSNSPNFLDFANPTNTNGNISQDPKLVSTASWDAHLMQNSPCIDAGSAETNPATDLDGTPRPLDGNADGISKPDIGCYEYSRGFQNIGEVKSLADGALVSLTGLVPTAVFQDRFYAETYARINGIGVTGFSVPMGKCLTVEGRMATVDGERLISAYNVIQGKLAATPAPWFMNPNAVGGGSLGLQAGVSGWRLAANNDDVGNPSTLGDLVTCGGANNIGLLIKTSGRVSYVDDNCFYVDGGCAFKDGIVGASGIRVMRLSTVDYDPQVGDNVIVTGISSCLGMGNPNDHYARLIRPIRVEHVSSQGAPTSPLF